MNPKVYDVRECIRRIDKKNPTSATVKGTIYFPDWFGINDHIQGVAPINGVDWDTGCISGSSTTGAYFATFQASSSGSPVVKAVSIWGLRPKDFDHGGGVQLLSHLLPLPAESDNDKDKGVVGFYDVKDLTNPLFKYNFTMPGRKASSAAITNLTSGTAELALLAVYEYDHRHMRFYLADYTTIWGDASPWSEIYHYTGDLLSGGDQYQTFAMVTNTANEPYLLGFRGDSKLEVFKIESQNQPFAITGLTHEETFDGWDGASWRYGTGAQIVNHDRIRIFATDKDPEGNRDDYTFGIYIWS
jgi:hypothetical protein